MAKTDTKNPLDNSPQTDPLVAPNKSRYSDIVNDYKRDSNGFVTNVSYIFNSDKSIDWRAMIKPEHLVPNKDAFKNDPDVDLKSLDVTTLPDNKLLILLAGVKELAQLRGFTSVNYDVLDSRPGYVSVKCTIDFLPNYETDGKEIRFSALADAHWENTQNFAQNFLISIAENRAFVRCVRSFLKIHITGNDELGGKNIHNESEYSSNYSSGSSVNSSPSSLLEKTMLEHGVTFEKLKNGAILRKMEGAETWNSCEDIPPLAIFSIISGIKEKAKNVPTNHS